MADQFGQDWKPVTLGKRAPTSHTSKTVVTQAQREGASLETTKKYGGGANKKATTSLNTKKLDEETEELHHDHVSHDLKVQIMQARQAKKWTQKQLAQAINEKPTVVNDYEAGRAIPNQQIISRMERALGTRLRGGKNKK